MHQESKVKPILIQKASGRMPITNWKKINKREFKNDSLKDRYLRRLHKQHMKAFRASIVKSCYIEYEIDGKRFEKKEDAIQYEKRKII